MKLKVKTGDKALASAAWLDGESPEHQTVVTPDQGSYLIPSCGFNPLVGAQARGKQPMFLSHIKLQTLSLSLSLLL